MAKKKPTNNVGADFSLSALADETMNEMNGTTSTPSPGEKNVSLQVRESIRTRLRKMSAENGLKIQGFVERALDQALSENGY